MPSAAATAHAERARKGSNARATANAATAAGFETSIATEPQTDEVAYPNNNNNGTQARTARSSDTAAPATIKMAAEATAKATTASSHDGFDAAPATANNTAGKYPRDRLDVHVEKAIAAFKAST